MTYSMSLSIQPSIVAKCKSVPTNYDLMSANNVRTGTSFSSATTIRTTSYTRSPGAYICRLQLVTVHKETARSRQEEFVNDVLQQHTVDGELLEEYRTRRPWEWTKTNQRYLKANEGMIVLFYVYWCSKRCKVHTLCTGACIFTPPRVVIVSLLY